MAGVLLINKFGYPNLWIHAKLLLADCLRQPLIASIFEYHMDVALFLHPERSYLKHYDHRTNHSLISFDSLNANLGLERLIASLTLDSSGLKLLRFHLGTSYRVFPLVCHTYAVNSLSIDKIGYEYLLSGGNDGAVNLWGVSPETSGEYRTIGKLTPAIEADKSKYQHNFGISAVRWWPFDTGVFVTSSFDKSLKLWNTETLELVHSFNNDKMVPTSFPDEYASTDDVNLSTNYFGQIYTVDFSPTLEHALLGIASQGTNYAKLLDLRTMTVANYLFGHSDPSVTSLKWHPTQSNILATGGIDGEAKVWDIRKANSCVQSLSLSEARWTQLYGKAHSKAVNGLCWSTNGARLITAGLDNAIRSWAVGTNKGTTITKRVVVRVGKRKKVVIKDLVQNNFLQTVDPITTLISNSNDELLMYPSNDGKIYMFDFEGNLLHELARNDLEVEEKVRQICLVQGGDDRYFSGTSAGHIDSYGVSSDIFDAYLPEESTDVS